MSFDITITPALPEYLEYTNKIYTRLTKELHLNVNMDDNVDITLLKRIRNSEKFANALLVIRNKPDFSSLSFRIPEGKNLHAHDLDLTALKSIKSLIKAYDPSKQEKQLEILKVPQF